MGAACAQILRHVVAAVAGADHDRLAPVPRRAVGVLAGMHHRAGEVVEARERRLDRNGTDAGGEDDMARMQHALGAVAALQGHRPALRGFVIAAGGQLRVGPVVEVEILDIGFEPVRQLVLGNEHRKGRRERHQRQVIDVHLVVQGERVIAPPPVVADPLVAIDDQRVDAQRPQARGGGEARLAAADHEHDGIAILVGLRLDALVEPIGAAEVAAVALGIAQFARPAVGPAVQFLERGEQRPGAPGSAVVDQTRDGVGPPEGRLELEDRLDAIDAGPLHAARRRARSRNVDVPRRGPRQQRRQRGRDRGPSRVSDDVPGEGQHVAPVSFGQEGSRDGRRILRLEGGSKRIEPVRGDLSRLVRNVGNLYGHERLLRMRVSRASRRKPSRQAPRACGLRRGTGRSRRDPAAAGRGRDRRSSASGCRPTSGPR